MADGGLANKTDTRFWRAMGALLIVAIFGWAAWAIEMHLSDWVGKSSIGSAFGIVVWVGAFASCALFFMIISLAQNLLQTVAATYRPLVLVLVAAFCCSSTIRAGNSASVS